jgi:hypothetical protein
MSDGAEREEAPTKMAGEDLVAAAAAAAEAGVVTTAMTASTIGATTTIDLPR